MTTNETTKERLARILAETRVRKAASGNSGNQATPFQPQLQAKTTLTPGQKDALEPSQERKAELIAGMLEKATGVTVKTYNEKQRELINWITDWKPKQFQNGWNVEKEEDKELVFIGAAGTGKTTAIRGALENIAEDTSYPILTGPTKNLVAGMKGIVCVSYTNKAVAQIKRNVPDSFKPQCLTIHKLIEFEPIFYDVIDDISGETRTKMKFEPARHAGNKLPSGLRTVIIDESSMVDERLFKQLKDALPMGTRIVFIGDLNQLPPVFGDSILGRKMISMPVIELTEVYRQALDSPIISLAWNILQGKFNLFHPRTEPGKNGGMVVPSYRRFNESAGGKVKLIPWAKKLAPNIALLTIVKNFCKLADSGGYVPEEDMILIPYNVEMGTIEANKGIAQHLGKKREAVVHEVISGIAKHYFAVGDKVLHNKEEFIITDIVRNGGYFGQSPKDPSKHLDRWGNYRERPTDNHADELINDPLEDIDALLESLTNQEDGGDEERFNQASHIIKIENLFDRTVKRKLNTAGEINSLLFAYAITVHKAQGSEWRRVFLVLHNSHKTMHFRELLYTAVTRAREELQIICEPDSIEKCIKNPRIKGNTLEAKLDFLRKKFAEKDAADAKAKAAAGDSDCD